MQCKYCGKECKNLNSLRQHEIRCKENPDRLEPRLGVNNPNYGKKGSNQFTKAKREGRECTFSEDTRKKLTESAKDRRHTEETKKKLSEHAKKNGLGGYVIGGGRGKSGWYRGIIL